ncbi:hypothetical protein Tsubulata_035251 [Turnera subulata]|uniref:DUF4283 domain-containing protein n=1 Tax=Turnera subulata TaxID=218843 RepID=A0A9Q0JE85_9ROSI|nr:hypothetical protein Tsubulata_035251 [Turnera subulata]
MTKEGLSYLASATGKPLHMNQDCSTLLSSDRVTVCIDVDYSKPLLNELVVALDGCTHKIEISYSWKPMHCDLCNKWGHHHLPCSTKQPSTQWIPKAIPTISLKPTVQSRMDGNPALTTNSICATDTNNAPQPVTHDSGNSPSKLIPKVSAPISSDCTQTASNSSIEINAPNVPPTTSASETGVNPSPKKPRKAAARVQEVKTILGEGEGFHARSVACGWPRRLGFDACGLFNEGCAFKCYGLDEKDNHERR